jgi:ribonuclease HII
MIVASGKAKTKASDRLFAYDEALRAEHGPMIVGVDEAGRGAWMSAISAGAVILPAGVKIDGLNDSKLINSEQRRDELAAEIKAVAIAWCVELVEAPEIDAKGIQWANATVMARAAQRVSQMAPDVIDMYVVDQSPPFPWRPLMMMPKADGTSLTVAAAAILAKTTRDAIVKKLALLHPEYGWDSNDGYVRGDHVEAVRKYGLVDGIHRKCWSIKALSPVSQLSLEDLESSTAP